MKNYTVTLLILLVVFIAVGIGVFLIFNQPEKTSQLNNVEVPIVEQEPEVITSEIDTSDWQTYRNEELGIEFKYPANFYLLDRLLEKEKAILISDEEIVFNEFLNGYFAPISIGLSNQKDDSTYINSINTKDEQQKLIDGQVAKIIKGQFPTSPPYGKFNTRVVVIDEKNITIKASDVRTFAGGSINFDLDEKLNNLLNSIKWIN